MLMETKTPEGAAWAFIPDHARLADLDLLGDGFELSYDRLTALACDLLIAPTGAMSIIDDLGERQYFKSYIGLSDELQRERGVLLSQSLCKTVRATDATLSITDTREDERFRDHPAHLELGVVAYLGQPIHLPTGEPVGALCVFDSTPRDWTEADKHRLGVLAGCVDEAIRRIAAAREAEIAQRAAARAMGARELFLAGLNHEIRTALNGVMGASAVLNTLPLDETAKPLVGMIEEAGNELHMLLETLLNQTDAASLKPQGEALQSLHEIFAEVLGVLRYTRLGGQHRFTLDLRGDDAPISDVDARRIKQLAYDLLGSAVVASPSGSTNLRVTVSATGGVMLTATMTTDPQSDDDLRSALGEVDFRQICNLAIAARGGFDIVKMEPDCVVLEIRLPFEAGTPRAED